MIEVDREEYVLTLAGRVRCKRCQAKAKRSQLQCLLPAVTGKRVCRVHGGLSRGPVTKEGRKRCGAAKLIHGRETRLIRTKRRQKLSELKQLEHLARRVGMVAVS